MANQWTAERISERVQELIGEPAGGFYNWSDRLVVMNTGQEELVLETQALTTRASIPLVDGQGELPDDLLELTHNTPYLQTAGGNQIPLEMVGAYHIEENFPIGAGPFAGTPTLATVEDDTIFVYPKPTEGDVVIRYVVRPADMVDFEDVPFNGSPRLNRYAEGIAFYTATRIMLPRNPQLATVYQNAYIQTQKNMRHDLRSRAHTPSQLRINRIRSYR